MNIVTNKLIMGLFAIISIALLALMLLLPQINYGGDIVEYHGVTESIIKDGKIYLTKETADNISRYLSPAYLQDPGYYIEGRDGERYPVHFIFYSILALPVRLILKLFELNELNTLRLTNLVILLGTTYFVLRTFLKENFQKVAFMGFMFLSPLLWFIVWPGPDMFYLCMLLLGIFFFLRGKYLPAVFLTVLASWHSQPLILTAAAMGAYVLYKTVKVQREEVDEIIDTNDTASDKGELIADAYLAVHGKTLLLLVGAGLLAFVPYLYNLYAFGILTPWTALLDGWTIINGFGLHNARLGKFFEQLFDLNFGLFWYAPVLFIFGVLMAIKSSIKRKDVLFLTLLFFPVTALFYQTNPAWHYGTSGFGPSRHAIFLLPLLIAYATYGIQTVPFRKIILTLFVITQLGIASFNGFAYPNLMNTLEHSPYATFVLNTFPALYNPTPEIFVDRTNHIDLTYPQTAIYKQGDVCKKAYVLITDKDKLIKECGSIPAGYEDKFDNPYARKTNFKRTIKTIEVTLWPDPGSCGDNFFPTDERPYVCMKTPADVMRETGVKDETRIENVDKLPGVWKIKTGTPVAVTIPPGYFAHHYSFDGFYVTY